MKANEHKGAEEAMNKELEAMEAMEGEFGESEPVAVDEGLIPDDEVECLTGGILPTKTTASPGRPDSNPKPSPQIRQ